MSIPSPPLQSLAVVAAQLPFHLNDTKQVNAAFRRWREQEDSKAKYNVDLWTYCFVRRYFVVKFTHDACIGSPADLDVIIEQVYVKIQDRRGTVSDTMRYASWVSVVCRNTFLNYMRGQNQHVSLEHDVDRHLSVEDQHYDAGLALDEIQQAIARLPEFLREVAHLRFIDGCSHVEIGQIANKPLATVRSYVNKAVKKLRVDSQLLDFLGPPQ